MFVNLFAEPRGHALSYPAVYELVLRLRRREKDARHKAVTDLAWLTSAWADGPPGTF